jgi:hypothetical protein
VAGARGKPEFTQPEQSSWLEFLENPAGTNAEVIHSGAFGVIDM